MENKKLVNILLKDMGELEELISEIKNRGNFDAMEIGFLHTRAKGIQQLLQMLNGFEPEMPSTQKTIEVEEKTIETPAIKKVAEKENVDISEERTKEELVKEAVQKEEVFSEAEPVEYSDPLKVVEIEEKPIIQVEEKVEEPIVSIEENFKKDEVELEDEDIDPNQRLGDSFLKGKSINDLVEDHNNLEHKLSNRPVSSIQAAIGINDRFQYIRELFEGSSDKFSEAVTSIDTMNNINEAVVYLQQNFKWKKNETSLKFVNLVKRRFINE